MLTTIEKVIALQDVDIFSQVSTEELGYLAAIAVEETHAQGASIYLARDPADSMYQVIEGRVRLHRSGDQRPQRRRAFRHVGPVR